MSISKPSRPLFLASSSPYRKALLERLCIDFTCITPDVDETRRPGESAAALATRLAAAKARAIVAGNGVVIGSDQVPALRGSVLRKPGDRSKALAQLLACQGETVSFYTALCVLDAESGASWEHIDETLVRFARLDRQRLERYLDIEQPFDCAGGFKAEGLGITLFTAIESKDPTALIGLPLIMLGGFLRAAGIDPLSS